PIGRRHQSLRQQRDVETDVTRAHVRALLLRRQQVQEERGEAGVLERFRDEPVPWAVSAASAAMREEHGAAGVRGSGKVAVENGVTGADANLALLEILEVGTGHGPPPMLIGECHETTSWSTHSGASSASSCALVYRP